MQVDLYASPVHPRFALVMLAGTDPATLTGEAGAARDKLAPLQQKAQAVPVAQVVHPATRPHFEREIGLHRMSVVKLPRATSASQS